MCDPHDIDEFSYPINLAKVLEEEPKGPILATIPIYGQKKFIVSSTRLLGLLENLFLLSSVIKYTK